jgi:AAA15 family ATPase/GTPase
MIESLSIENFRCFESLKLSNLKRVNVIVGTNGSGKSALLEALLLGLRATPLTVINVINTLRGVALPQLIQVGAGQLGVPVISPSMFQSLWDPLFSHQDNKKTIRISYRDSYKTEYSLKLYYAFDRPVPIPQAVPAPFASNVAPIIFERKKGNEEPKQTPVSVNAQNQIAHDPLTESLGPDALYFAATSFYAEVDNARWMSNLALEGKEKEVNDIIGAQFPQIKQLQVLSPVNLPAIWATLTSGEKRPVSLVSAGIHKFLTLVLASVSARNGVVIVDELENGIFYEKFGALWETLYKLCEKNGTQIFVTTHSDECLKAVAPVIDGRDKEFCLLRSEILNGQCRVVEITGAAMRDALRTSIEIRGHAIGESTVRSR